MRAAQAATCVSHRTLVARQEVQGFGGRHVDQGLVLRVDPIEETFRCVVEFVAVNDFNILHSRQQLRAVHNRMDAAPFVGALEPPTKGLTLQSELAQRQELLVAKVVGVRE